MLAQAEIRRGTGERTPSRVIYDEETIARRVAELAREIDGYYPSGELVLIGVLKGAFVFLADLIRKIARPVGVHFLVVESYGSGMTSSGDVRLRYEPDTPLDGKHVLLVEDIIDSGTTLQRVVRWLERRRPRSVEVCALLDKGRNAESRALRPRFVGFSAPDEFLVGYGLDHAEDFRHLPFIASIGE